MTRRPVFDETGRVCPEVLAVVNMLKKQGKDPIKELKECKYYLENSISEMERNKDIYYKWQLYSKKKFRTETKASLEYMLEGVNALIASLALEKLDEVLGNTR